MSSKRTLYVLYGKKAARFYKERGIGALLSDNDSLEMQILERHFSTNAENQAYLYGIEDSMGWEGYAIMDNKDYLQFSKKNDKQSNGDTYGFKIAKKATPILFPDSTIYDL